MSTSRENEVTLARLAGLVTAFIDHTNRRQHETDAMLRSHHASILNMEKQISHITCLLILHITKESPTNTNVQVTTTPILSRHPPPGFPEHVNMQHQDVTPWNSPQGSTTSEESEEETTEDETDESDEESEDSDDSILGYDGFDRMFDETLAAYEKEKAERLRLLPQLVGEDPRDLYLKPKVEDQPKSNSIMTFFGVGKDAKDKKKEGGKECGDFNVVVKRSEETQREIPPKPSRDMNLPVLKEEKRNHENVVQGRFEKGESSQDQQKSRKRGSLNQGRNVWGNFIKTYLGKANEENGGKASPDANNST